ncbi:FAD:protein FMN transferase [Methylomarinovum tepidoasis]|uniref:FAD:protein FMN transferase n=1 Tax=Methylomarinovum tepidoasis TaxID=2840183 RepID=A0AAU9CBT9_9GAMM|nr:FAD:protein FMN transferase [Methylomarinovum sp. IN45]BCX89417.1 FAD:protein FMN transferase [Methylomarinovum sp. IN45]
MVGHRLRGAFGLLVLFLLAACQPAPPKAQFEQRGLVMGTTFSIKVTRLPEGVDPEALRRGLERVLTEVDATMSTYRQDSPLSRFNRSTRTDWQPVPPALAQVVAEALRISRWSDGAFDITVGPLVNLWGFGPDPRRQAPPPVQAIAAAKARIGHDKLEVRLDPPALRKRIPDLYVDLSGIAKGFAVDQAAVYLESQGISDYMVEIGGEVRLKGESPRGGPWRIAIEKPVPKVREIEKVLSLTDIALATSGDYRNYFEVGGKRFSHTIDPRTGHPIAHRLVSVTVLRHTTMEADALATAFMVLGPEAGFAKAEAENMAVLFIVKEDDGFVERPTSAFRQFIGGGAS